MGDDPFDLGLSSTSSNHTTLQPPYDDYIDVDESDEDDESKSELGCPFCFEGFDAVGLWCHLYEHPIETKSGICPICATSLGTSMAAHLIKQHENILKTLHKKKLCYGESRSILSLMGKELLDEHLQSLHEGSSCVVSSSNMEPDPMLLSFIYNPPPADEPETVQPGSSTEASLSEKSSDKSLLERHIQPCPLSNKDQEERAQRCEFVHSLLFSTIFDDNL